MTLANQLSKPERNNNSRDADPECHTSTVQPVALIPSMSLEDWNGRGASKGFLIFLICSALVTIQYTSIWSPLWFSKAQPPDSLPVSCAIVASYPTHHGYYKEYGDQPLRVLASIDDVIVYFHSS